jgi:hypothetical protein
MGFAANIAIALGLTLAATGVVRAQSVGRIDADAPAPIYLYEDAFGNVLTYDVVSAENGRMNDAGVRYVSRKELSELSRAGFEVRLIRADEKAGGEGDPIIPPLPELPENFSIVQFKGVVYGNFFVPGDRPEGATTQWLSYFFKSINMRDFGTHMAISLLFDSDQLIYAYPPTYAPAVVGNGMIIGNVAGTPNGCGFGTNDTPMYNMQVESYWNGGNRLYPETCSPRGLDDSGLYYVDLSADTAGHVTYDAVGSMIWLPPVVDTAPDRPQGTPGSLSGGGLMFGLVGIPSYPKTVALNFFGAKTGWF